MVAPIFMMLELPINIGPLNIDPSIISAPSET